MPSSEARIRANAKWAAKSLDQVKFTVRKGQRDIIRTFAEEHGYSMNAFILESVTEKMERMGYQITEQQDENQCTAEQQNPVE